MSYKVFHLTSVHTVFDTRIFHKECVSLAQLGFDVTLIAADCEEQDICGVKIRSVPKEPSRFKRIFKTPWKLYRKALKGKADICHFHDPELMFIGILLRLHGKKVIYDVHEDYPRQNLEKFWIPIFLRWPISMLIASIEWFGSRFFFTSIVAATPVISDRFPPNKTVVVQNFPELQELTVEQSGRYAHRPENIVYLGIIAGIRGVFENVKAMQEVRHADGKLVLVGKFSSEREEQMCRRLAGWERVDFQGWGNREQIAHILADARVGLVLLHPTTNYLDSFPVKLFEYMAAGIPVIASDFPLWREIIEKAKCGLLVDPLQPKRITEAIDWILDNPNEAEQMGRNGRKAVVDRFNWTNESEKLIELYNGELTL